MLHASADAARVPPPSASATAHIANFFFEALLMAIYFLLSLSYLTSPLYAQPVIKLRGSLLNAGQTI